MYNSSTQEIAAETRLVGAHIDQISRKTVPFPTAIAERGSQQLNQ